MSTRKVPLPIFAVGSEVRVKTVVTAANRHDMPVGGWHGKVYEVSGSVCLVHWSNATLEALRSIHRERQRDGADFQFMWLQANELEADFGEPC